MNLPCLTAFCFVMIECYLLKVFCFLKGNRDGVYLGKRGDGENWEE